MKFILPAFILLFLVTACHSPSDNSATTSSMPSASSASSSPSTDTAGNQKDTAQKGFLPVAGYLRSEISYVDSTPLAILKYTVRDGRTDSSFINPSEFNQLAREFLMPELAPVELEKNFIESSFQDETTGYLTFSYGPRDPNSPLQRIDVLTAPDKGANKVNSIFMERVARTGDTLVTKKMYWKAGHSFLVITSSQSSKKDPVVRQSKVVWNAE